MDTPITTNPPFPSLFPSFLPLLPLPLPTIQTSSLLPPPPPFIPIHPSPPPPPYLPFTWIPFPPSPIILGCVTSNNLSHTLPVPASFIIYLVSSPPYPLSFLFRLHILFLFIFFLHILSLYPHIPFPFIPFSHPLPYLFSPPPLTTPHNPLYIPFPSSSCHISLFRVPVPPPISTTPSFSLKSHQCDLAHKIITHSMSLPPPPFPSVQLSSLPYNFPSPSPISPMTFPSQGQATQTR